MAKTIKFILGVLLLFSIVANSKADNKTIPVGELIKKVISGKNYAGKEITVSGIALNQTNSGSSLLNLATPKTFKSGVYKNFISIYGVQEKIGKGNTVVIRIKVEESISTKMGKEDIVLVESAFLECFSCPK